MSLKFFATLPRFLHQVGQDGWNLLAAIEAQAESRWMLSIPAIDTLQRMWKQNYLPLEEGETWIAEEDRLEAAGYSLPPTILMHRLPRSDPRIGLGTSPT
jgi:hypothetical protein